MKTKELFPKLKAKMAYYGETQKDIAKLLDLSELSIVKRFKGTVEWNLTELRTIANHYNCKIDDLV